jgi:hypothetical protein
MVAPSVAGPQQSAWFRALERARLVGVKPTYHLGKDYYSVTSPRAGDVYEIRPVEVDGKITYSCTCPAGAKDLVCWHKALVAALPFECKRRAAHGWCAGCRSLSGIAPESRMAYTPAANLPECSPEEMVPLNETEIADGDRIIPHARAIYEERRANLIDLPAVPPAPTPSWATCFCGERFACTGAESDILDRLYCPACQKGC